MDETDLGSDKGDQPLGDPRRGELIDGRYELLELLGIGGMGVVYKAWHTMLKTTVALKLLKPEAGQVASLVDQMLVEAQAAARIKHPYVVSVHNAGRTSEGEVFIVMEHIEGDNLETLLASEQALAVDRVRSLLLQLATGLAAAHAQGVIHRDIKPANCMITRDSDGNEMLKILDFGIAKILEDTNETAKVNPSTRPWHTRHYAAPEVRHGSASSKRSDVYSLGVLAYRLLTKRYPLDERLKLTPAEKYRPDIPLDLRELLRDMLETDPDERPQTMVEVCQRLRDGITGDYLGPESSFGAQTAPEGNSLNTAPAQTLEQAVPGPKRPSALALSVRWTLLLAALGTATTLIADSRRIGNQVRPPVVTNNIRNVDSPTRAGVGGAAASMTIPLPEDDGENETAAEGETEGEAEGEAEGERETGEEDGTGEDGETGEQAAAPAQSDQKPAKRQLSQGQRNRKAVERCLRKSQRPCVSGSEWLELESFQVRDKRALYPKLESSSQEAKGCVLKTLSGCRLPDGRYDDLNIRL